MKTETFTIDTEVTPAYFNDLLDFIYQNYILPHQDFFKNIRKVIVNDEHFLFFTSITPDRKSHIDVGMKAGKPIQVKMTADEILPQNFIDDLKENLIINVQLFEEKVRRTTLYFAWVKGEEIAPEKMPTKRKKTVDRLFTETMLLFYIILIGASIFLFFIIGIYAIIFIIAFQFIIILLSDKIMARAGGWMIDSKNPNVYLLQYHLPVEEYKEFQSKYRKEFFKIKREIYEKSFVLGKEPDCKLGEEIFSKYGIKCVPERMSIKTVNVYEIVKKATEKFNMPMPKIMISNVMMPNAAATGPSPTHGTVMITTGLLVQLEEDEILSVVGHELAHLKGRDSVILFSLTTAEYLLRIFVFLPLFLLFPLVYLVLAMSVIYFIAKFFEARADLLSAMKIGQPQVLAEALRKIGFRRLRFERSPSYRVQSWIGLDPHPPIYFRINRLEKLKMPSKVKYPLIQSVKDVINGFRSAL
ncbi:MAG: M48 family metalloprotease [archaeon]|nr:M48 family metalloprotease [archaeon]